MNTYLVQVTSKNVVGVSYASVVKASSKKQAKKVYCSQLLKHWNTLTFTNQKPIKVKVGCSLKQIKALKFAVSASVVNI